MKTISMKCQILKSAFKRISLIHSDAYKWRINKQQQQQHQQQQQQQQQQQNFKRLMKQAFNHIECNISGRISNKTCKSTTLVKKCNPSRGPTKHRKGPFPPERTEKGLSGTEKDICVAFLNSSINLNPFLRPKEFQATAPISAQCFDFK